jgi:steroid delta-isomerase-like uncharacterized protein
MDPLLIAQQYFDGWNRRDPAAVLTTMAPSGTYADPTTGGPLSGDAFAGYMSALFAAFPDVSFELTTEGLAAPDLVAAQWIMRGTNRGSMSGLPPTNKPIEVRGADFIRVASDGIASVTGYFDAGVIPRQLGLQVIVQPTAIGPFSFGTATRVAGPKSAKPGAFSITALRARSPEDAKGVSDSSRQIATEMLSMKGFIGFVGVVVGDRMLTISAWENPSDPKQLMTGGTHREATKKFFGTELGGGGYTAVLVPDRINTMWVRCLACQKMTDYASVQGQCGCGATLPEPISYW